MVEALEHLGNLLYILSDLHPDDQSKAYCDALEFYNKARPDNRVEPSGFRYQRLVEVRNMQDIFTEEYLNDAHKFASKHRENVEASTCGCFYCGALFDGERVTEWIDDDQTALCPECGIDSVISTKDVSAMLDSAFRTAMHDYWFGRETESRVLSCRVIEKSDEPSDETLRQKREIALNKLSDVIAGLWGRRCDRFEAGCTCCIAWGLFDLMEKITDGTLLDRD